MEYWRSNPPTHILMKAQVQFKEPSKTATKNQPQDATELMMMFGMNADGTGVLRG